MGHKQSIQQLDMPNSSGRSPQNDYINPLTLTFGTAFGCSLIKKTLRPYSIPLDDKKMRVLLISDTHIGAVMPCADSIQLFYNELSQIVKDEQITMICHLGDLINNSISNGQNPMKEVLLKMSELQIPVYFIGGNHDRNFMQLLDWSKNDYVNPLFNKNAILFEIPSHKEGQEPTKYYFGHDLENNYRVTDKFAVLFVNWLKDGFSKDIAPNDWLIIGHSHVATLCPSTRIGCIGQFSPEINEFAYGIFEIDQGNACFYNSNKTSKIVNPEFKFGMNQREQF